ncbi:MAG: MFS transporter [Pseudomonadota bacterium]
MESGLLVYALPALATQLALTPIFSVLPGLYATEFGVNVAVIGAAVIIMRLWDALTDPVVGALSDRTRTPLGPRAPFMIAGLTIASAGGWFLFVPPNTPSLWTIALSGIVFFVGWTLIEVPHTAWGTELSREPTVRTRLFLYRSLAGVAGGLLFAAMPYMPWSPGPAFSAQTLRDTILAFMLVGAVSIFLCVWLVPKSPTLHNAKRQADTGRAMQAAMRNAPFWRFLAAFSLSGLGIGAFNTLQFIYLKSYLGYDAEIPIVIGAGSLAALLALPVWLVLVNRFGKVATWCVGMGLVALFIAPVAFVPPGPDYFILYLCLSLGVATCAGAGIIVPFSLLGDVIDFDTLKSGLVSTGLYTSFFLLVVKMNGAIGGGVGLIALEWIGFDPNAVGHSPQAVLGFKTLISGLTSALLLAGTLLLWRFPINAKRHAIIRRALDRQGRGKAGPRRQPSEARR